MKQPPLRPIALPDDLSDAEFDALLSQLDGRIETGLDARSGQEVIQELNELEERLIGRVAKEARQQPRIRLIRGRINQLRSIQHRREVIHND